MDNEKFIFYQKYYDVNLCQKIISLLSKNKIRFKIEDKSGPTNFRVPSSTFSEIDLFIEENNFAPADKIIKNFN